MSSLLAALSGSVGYNVIEDSENEWGGEEPTDDGGGISKGKQGGGQKERKQILARTDHVETSEPAAEHGARGLSFWGALPPLPCRNDRISIHTAQLRPDTADEEEDRKDRNLLTSKHIGSQVHVCHLPSGSDASGDAPSSGYHSQIHSSDNALRLGHTPYRIIRAYRIHTMSTSRQTETTVPAAPAASEDRAPLERHVDPGTDQSQPDTSARSSSSPDASSSPADDDDEPATADDADDAPAFHYLPESGAGPPLNAPVTDAGKRSAALLQASRPPPMYVCAQCGIQLGLQVSGPCFGSSARTALFADSTPCWNAAPTGRNRLQSLLRARRQSLPLPHLLKRAHRRPRGETAPHGDAHRRGRAVRVLRRARGVDVPPGV